MSRRPDPVSRHESTDSAQPVLSARRLFWVCMLVLHAPALLPLWQTIALSEDAPFWAAARLVALTAAAAFFVFKIVDVPWLRLKSGPRSAVTAVLIVALLHVGVFDRAIQGEADLSPARVGVVFIVGTTCRTETIQRGLMFLSRILAAAGRATTERQLRSLPFCHPAWELACLLDLRSLVPSYSGPRAPPCRVTI